jgi:hypothetical protein
MELSDYPLYNNKHGHRDDYPVGSVIAVGYTVGTYKGTKAKVTCLSPNLLFGILLAIPSKAPMEA